MLEASNMSSTSTNGEYVPIRQHCQDRCQQQLFLHVGKHQIVALPTYSDGCETLYCGTDKSPIVGRTWRSSIESYVHQVRMILQETHNGHFQYLNSNVLLDISFPHRKSVAPIGLRS